MIVKRKLYSVMDEEGNLGYYFYNESTGEEKLFSVEDEKDSPKKSKIRTAGKIAALGGTAGSLGIAIPTAYKLNKLQNEVGDKVAKKYNVRNAGGLLFFGDRANVTKAAKVHDRALRRIGNNRLVKAGGIAADALAGAAILGTGAYLYGRHKDNKKKSK